VSRALSSQRSLSSHFPAQKQQHAVGAHEADVAPPGSTTATAPSSFSPSSGALGIYAELAKSKLSALVVATTAAGYLMAPVPIEPATLASAIAGTFLCSASANSFNQVIEVKRDAMMNRTCRRPLPSGRISRAHAVVWASSAGVAGVTMLALCTNLTTAALGAGTIGLYTLVYTPLKVVHPLNTWVGAVVGAIPPVMGWTAAGGSLLSIEPLMLSAALFLWQIPHFLALAWMYRADYEQGGYKMLPLTDPSGERTSAVCLEYTGYLTALPFACWAAGLTSCMFPVESIAFNGAMLVAAARFAGNSQRGQAHARRLFLVSLAYLPLFFGCFLVHQRRAHLTEEEEARHVVEVGEPSEADADAHGDVRERLRQRGRQICIHEKLSASNNGSSGLSLCPVSAADELIASAKATASSSQSQ